MALPRQLKEIGFTSGLNTKGDERAQPEQLLAIATNVEFDDVGGLRVRYPFDNVRTALVGGGTLSNTRKFVTYGDRLLCFTVDSLYSWSAANAGWIKVGTHLAVEIDERERFVSPSDAIQCDRATLLGITVYTWTDNGNVWIAGVDAGTGGVTYAPKAIDTGNGSTSPRLVATATAVLLFYVDKTAGLAKLIYRTLNPLALDNVGDNTAAGAVTNATNTLAYDAVRIPGADAAIVAQSSGGSPYRLAIAPPGGIVVTTAAPARTSTGAIAIACTPDGAHAQVIRVDTNIKGDYINAATLADVTTNQAIGTIAAGANRCDHIAACYRSVADAGHFRCYAFWTDGHEPSPIMVNWVDDAGTIGTAATIVRMMGIASRAFDVGGRVFLWTVFGSNSVATSSPVIGALQNTMFLFRDDGFQCGKSLATRASGFLQIAGLVSMATVLPGVESIGANQYALAATERRKVPLTGVKSFAYSARAPRDLTFAFDSNRARRAAGFGATLYLAAGEVLQYDGAALNELGWHIAPWDLSLTAHVAGSMANGLYAYQVRIRWDNASGERDRSTVTTTGQFTVAGGPAGVRADLIVPIFTTHKRTPAPAVEVWRTEVNPTLPAPMFLDTSNDPTVLSGANRYLANDTTVDALPTFDDEIADTGGLGLGTRESIPVDGTLEALAPPAAKIIYASDTRLFLAGIAGLPNQVWYSKTRITGRVAEFNDQLTFDVPTDGGAITNIGELDGALIVWCETATYQFSGGGFDNIGAGANFALARILSPDLGCVGPEACALADDAFFVKTNKGWFALGKALNYQYIGDGVAKYDAEPVLATVVLTGRHQVRILTTGRMLVFDTLVKQWAETSVNDGLDMLLWNGTPAYLTATGVRAELATWDGYTGTDYTLTLADVELGWVKFGAMQARAIVDFVQLLGELRSTCVIRKRLAKDYEASAPGVWNYTTDKTWTPSPGIVASKLDVRQAPQRKRCESFKPRFTITASDGVSPLGGPCVRLTSIAILYALEPNAYGALGAAQKQ